jgi:hypothetical protein
MYDMIVECLRSSECLTCNVKHLAPTYGLLARHRFMVILQPQNGSA